MARIGVRTIGPHLKQGDLALSPFSHLELTQYSRDGQGHVHLSPQLMTDSEVDYWVDNLIEQLEKARRKAKRDLKRAKGQFRADLRELN